MNALHRWSATVLLLVACACEYPHAIAADLSDWLHRTTFVAVVKVMEGRQVNSDKYNDACRFKYILQIETLIRGSQRSVQTILSDASLEIGSRYLLAAALDSPWNSRAFATDVPTLDQSKNQELCRSRSEIMLVRSAELRPIEKQLYSGKDWVAFPPHIFTTSSRWHSVSDVDRICLSGDRIEWPSIPFYDHYLLSEIISSMR